MSSPFNLLEWYKAKLKKIENIKEYTFFFYQPEAANPKRKELSLKCGKYYEWYDSIVNRYPNEEEARYIFDIINDSVSDLYDKIKVFPVAVCKETIEFPRQVISRYNLRVTCHSSIFREMKKIYPDISIVDFRFNLPPLFKQLPVSEEKKEDKRDINLHYWNVFKYRPYHNLYEVSKLEKEVNIDFIEKIFYENQYPIVEKFLDDVPLFNIRDDLILNDNLIMHRFLRLAETNWKYAERLTEIFASIRKDGRKQQNFLKFLNRLNGGGSSMVGTHKVLNLLIKDQSKDYNERDVMFNHYIQHEAFIGLAGTNALRREIPNFAYVYGIFNCALDKYKIDDVESADLICNSDLPYYTILYEEITDAESFKSFMQRIIKTKNYEKILTKIIYIIVLALAHAHAKCGFIHGDLHLENVLIKTLNKPMTVKYTLPAFGDVHITSIYVPIFIDYEYSQIIYDNNVITNLIPTYLCPYSQVPSLDVYKLMNFFPFLRELNCVFPGYEDGMIFRETFEHKFLCYEKFFNMTLEDFFHYMIKTEPEAWSELNDPRLRTEVFGKNIK